MVSKFGLMDQDMKEIGLKIKLMEKERYYTLTEIFTQENGAMTKLMDMANMNMPMVQFMLEIGLKINNTVKE